MTLKEKLDLLFYKNECMRIIIYRENKRIHEYIKRVKTGNSVSVGDGTYTIDVEKIFFRGGLPTIAYFENNPEAFDFIEGRFNNTMTSKMYQIALNETVTEHIISNAKDKKSDINSTLIYGLGGLGLVFAVGIYYLSDKIATITEKLAEWESIIRALQEIIANGGLN